MVNSQMASIAFSYTLAKRTYYDALHISTSATQDEIKQAYRSLVVRCHPDKLASSSKHHEIDKKANHENSLMISNRLAAIDLDDDEEDYDDETENDHCLDKEQNEAINAEHNIISSDATTEEEQISKAAKSFHEIHTAYECLRDPDKRMRYDQTLSRDKERKEWRKKGAIEVNLSDLESDMCRVVNEDDESDCSGIKNQLQKVYFHDCRCGDTFEIIEEELLLESMSNECIWQCESCSLGIRIILDFDVVS